MRQLTRCIDDDRGLAHLPESAPSDMTRYPRTKAAGHNSAGSVHPPRTGPATPGMSVLVLTVQPIR